jgi:hypothetical protein
LASGYHIGHAKGLARTRDPQQDLVPDTLFYVRAKLVYGLGLIPLGLIVADQLEFGHMQKM